MTIPLRYGLIAIIALWLANAAAMADFAFKNVQDIARAFAGEPYRQPEILAPTALLRLNYDRYRQIRFIPERSLWRGENLNFEVQFFHMGHQYDRAVKINVIDGEMVDPVNFSPDLFDYGSFKLSRKMLERLGFAGFRIHFPLNRPDFYDEFVVFLGASYFRMVGANQHYGLSGRAVAIDTALPSGEEFPWFREFWLVKPKPGDKTITLYALLDGPSLSGAYQFVITPANVTVTEVQATLFLRKPVHKLGLAPLTSMFLYGENSMACHCRYGDYRPEVHDSDGLLIAMDNEEWLWRPLVNEGRIDVNTFIANHPKGYGLLQRDRNFDHYQDLESHYELRPNAWIEPLGDWNNGKVELVALSAGEESFDNIVAYWTPDRLPKPLEAFSYQYKMYWSLRENGKPPAGYTLSTRMANGSAAKGKKFVLDFLGGAVDWLDNRSDLKADVSASKDGKIIEVIPYKNEFTNGWRLDFQVAPKDPLHPKPVELRVFLKSGQQALTETWTYTWHPSSQQIKK
jgi:glucans biosynthesis protein